VIPAVTAAELVGLSLTVDGVPAVIDSIAPALALEGPGNVAFETTLAGLAPGAHTLCATAEGTDAIGSNTVTECVTVTVNASPIALCEDAVVEADASCNAVVTAATIDVGSFDPDGDPVSCSITPEGPYAVGTTSATLTCTDPTDAAGSCTAEVEVVDATAPVLECPAAVTVECLGGAAEVDFASPVAADNCEVATVVCDHEPGVFPEGVTPVACQATDSAGNTADCSFDVTVADTSGPVVETVGTLGVLWPPDHSYHAFSIEDCITSITDACSGEAGLTASLQLMSIRSDEGELAAGSGQTCNDAIITGPTTFEVRAERVGGGDGRVYTATFVATDASGNATEASCQVHVPPNQGVGATTLDSGCAYCTGDGCGDCPGTDAVCEP
jgi:hypothetical protein